jgi:ABC-type transporter Mla maintaining outer membrane lipid asymmetry ATPase subunit MlaF
LQTQTTRNRNGVDKNGVVFIHACRVTKIGTNSIVMSLTVRLFIAQSRVREGCILGPSGIGKTSLLWTVDADTTLFFDLEAGDLAVEGWSGDAIRPRTWQECRDFEGIISTFSPQSSRHIMHTTQRFDLFYDAA